MSDIEQLIQKLKAFRDERDWEQFHNPKDLAIALSIESSELLELFLWKSHKEADIEKAIRIVVDSKTDYPSACNATECLLLHSSVVESGAADKILRQLRSLGVSLFGGPRALQLGLTERPAVDLRTEYGDLSLSVEVVDSVSDAIRHIHFYGR
jgi:gamma-glutamyl phosphate reductase